MRMMILIIITVKRRAGLKKRKTENKRKYTALHWIVIYKGNISTSDTFYFEMLFS